MQYLVRLPKIFPWFFSEMLKNDIRRAPSRFGAALPKSARGFRLVWQEYIHRGNSLFFSHRSRQTLDAGILLEAFQRLDSHPMLHTRDFDIRLADRRRRSIARPCFNASLSNVSQDIGYCVSMCSSLGSLELRNTCEVY